MGSPRRVEDRMIGQSLSHYEILAELGHGGMGVVYKARDTRLGRFVALKLLPPELAADPERVDLLRREAQAIAALDHPRIVTIYAVEEEAGQLFLTMEYVEGRQLDQLIPPDGLPLAEFFKIAIPLADALSSAHDRQIVHRDLKPGNIMISREGRPKILDFGLAKLRPDMIAGLQGEAGAPVDTRLETEPLTLEGRLAGTVPYMSPEQLCREPVDHRSDIFSLGVIYYEMATGRHPFRGRETSIASSILKDSPDSVADVRAELPRQLGRIIRRCLEKDPQKRTQSAKDLRNELEDLQLETHRPGPAAAAGRPAGRRPRLAVPALLAAVLAVSLGWWILDQRSGGQAPPQPHHLAVEEIRIFPGDRGPDYYRRGTVDLLRRRLSDLTGVFVVGDADEPLPDVLLEADARRAGETMNLAVRLLDAPRGRELADLVLEGSSSELPAFVDRAAQSVASVLTSQLGQAVRLRPRDGPAADPVALDLYLQAAAAARQRQPPDYAAARDLLRQALAIDSGLALAHLLDGQILLAQHRDGGEASLLAQSLEACRAAAAADPRLGAAQTCIGDGLSFQGLALDAVVAYRRAIELDTSDTTPHRGLRDAYLNLGLPESAERDWKELIRIHPSWWAGYYSLGTYYQDLERYEESLPVYRRALELAPRNPSTYAYLGTAYLFLGRYEEATVSLQRSIDIRPNWDAYYNLGGLNFSLRRFEASVAAYEKAVELRADDYRSYGRLGWACFWAPGRRDEAPVYLNRAIELGQRELARRPDRPSVLILQALFQAMVGDRAESLGSLERALELRPNDSHYFFLAGLTHNHLGDRASALEWLERAVQGGYSIADIRTTVDLDSLHSEPRFQQLLRTASLTAP